jgi:hypothetical protein
LASALGACPEAHGAPAPVIYCLAWVATDRGVQRVPWPPRNPAGTGPGRSAAPPGRLCCRPLLARAGVRSRAALNTRVGGARILILAMLPGQAALLTAGSVLCGTPGYAALATQAAATRPCSCS